MGKELAEQPAVRGRAGMARLVAAAAALACLAIPAVSFAYIGDSFLSIPGEPGHWAGREHKGWIRAEASDWPGRLPKLNSGSTDFLAGDKMFFGGSNAPRPGGPGKLTITLGKDNPDVKHLMEICTSKRVIPVMNYAESSDRARPLLELGPRPPQLPAWWEYQFSNVQIDACPVVDGAIDQAFMLSFKNITWLNADPAKTVSTRIVIPPQVLSAVTPAVPTAKRAVRSYVITWFGAAADTTAEQCPKMNAKPTEADVFRYMTPDQIARIRSRNGEKGLSYGTETENRGPDRISVANFPGVVPDPGLIEPKTSVANGIDLDGNDGSGTPPKGIRKHGNFVSPDGRKGIDNQLLRVWGCVPGLRGKAGYSNQTPNARRADGNVTTVVEVSGIDVTGKDKSVNVALIFSKDKPVRDNAGKAFIANYTFRPSTDPNFAYYNLRVHGRMENGVVTTDVIPHFQLNPGQGSLMEMYNARLRLEPQPDGSMRGWLAGYLPWKMIAVTSGYSEGLFDYQAPALYYAYRRNADGLRDPVTGEYDGISATYEIDTVPAFLAPSPLASR